MVVYPSIKSIKSLPDSRGLYIFTSYDSKEIMENILKNGFIWLFCIYMTIFIFYSAAANLKKVSLELGGKSPLIIFSDCELDRAVKMVVLLWSKIYSKPLRYILTVLQYSSWLPQKKKKNKPGIFYMKYLEIC